MSKRLPAASAWPYALVLAVGLAVLLPGLTQVGFWDPLEPKYIQGAREMDASGSRAVASYLGRALPVESLVYWSIRAGSAIFGLDELGARIGGVLVALLALLAVYYAVSRLRGRRAGLLSAVVLATCPQFYLLARLATSGIYVLAGFGVGLLFFGLAVYLPSNERRELHLAIGYACLAFAVLAGGGVVVLGCLVSTLVVWGIIRFDSAAVRRFLGSQDRNRRILRHALLAGVVGLVTVGPWIAMVAGERVAGGTLELVPETTGEPFHFYFRPLIFGLFPWICFLPMTISLPVRWRARDPFERHGFEGLLLVASSVTFAFVAFQEGKWPSYVSPLLVPLAVLIGVALDRMSDARDEAPKRLGWVLAALLFLPIMLDLRRDDGIKHLLSSVTENSDVPASLLPAPGAEVFLALLAAVLAIATLVRFRALVGVLSFAAVAFATYYGSFFLPSIDALKSMRPLCATWKTHRAEGQTVGFVGAEVGEAYYYCETRLEPLHESVFLQFMDPSGSSFSILGKEDWEKLRRLFQNQYPGGELVIVAANATHLLVANHDPGES